MICHQFIYFQRELASLEPQFDNCGEYCPPTGKYQNYFCESCPIKQAESSFRELSADVLKQNPKAKTEFENLYQSVRAIIAISDIPRAERTVKTDVLIKAWESEKAAVERIDDFNRRKPKD